MKINISKNIAWKSTSILTSLLLFTLYITTSCNDYPMDEDGLLITERAECYVSNFELVGTDYQTVRTKAPVIDTLACTIDVEVRYGTDLKNLWPQFSLVTDSKLDPKVEGWTDFSSLSRQWTVVSGDRKIRKTYTISISVLQP